MSRSYPTRSPRCRPFIVTSYVPDAEGRLVAEMPACCPLSESGPEQPCRLAVDHLRNRKTGPRHPLTVVACRTHACGFTLYPAGFAPYLRQPVLQVAPDGEPAPGGDHDEFADTVFEAAVDAKAGRAWARDTEDEDDPPERWWGTQRRHLEFAAQLVGVARDLVDGVRETIATALSVSTLVLREHSVARGYRGIGEAVCDVLDRLRGGARRAQQLLLCGHLIGRWGALWRWDAKRQLMERSPFLSGGTTDGSLP